MDSVLIDAEKAINSKITSTVLEIKIESSGDLDVDAYIRDIAFVARSQMSYVDAKHFGTLGGQPFDRAVVINLDGEERELTFAEFEQEYPLP